MSARQHFRLGVFVLGSGVALVGALIILTAGNFLRPSIPVETYLESSIQGLEVGAPVKFRGVTVGEVTGLTFTSVVYEADVSPLDRRRYVLVQARLYPNRFVARDRGEEFDVQLLEELVDAGLRVRMAAQGITGMNYLEADFADGEAHPPLEHDWEPESVYVPAAPSTTVQFIEAGEKLLRRLDKLDIEGVVDNTSRLLRQVESLLTDLEPGRLMDRTEQTLEELQIATRTATRMMESMQHLVEDPDTQALPGATRATLEELRETLEAADIGPLVERMDSMIARLERGTDAGEAKLLRTLDELQSAINGLRTLSEDVRRNPSGALFGAPPPRSAMDRE